MYQVGNIVKSPKALIRCLSKAIVVIDADGKPTMSTDPKQLIPNTGSVSSDKVFGKHPVYHGNVLIGRIDCVNTDASRENSLWKITSVDVDGSGHGDSHCVSGKNSVWAKRTYTAERVDASGAPHPSLEVLVFCNDSHRYVNDFVRIA